MFAMPTAFLLKGYGGPPTQDRFMHFARADHE
jgi:hypothetical protein